MKKKASNIAVGILAATVAIGTFVVLLLAPPEVIRETSQDGGFRVEGKGSTHLVMLVERMQTTPGPADRVIGPVYAVSVDGDDTLWPKADAWIITAAYDADALGDFSPTQLILLRFDDTQAAWKEHPAIVDTMRHTLTVEVEGDPTGMWAVGVAQDLSGG